MLFIFVEVGLDGVSYETCNSLRRCLGWRSSHRRAGGNSSIFLGDTAPLSVLSFLNSVTPRTTRVLKLPTGSKRFKQIVSLSYDELAAQSVTVPNNRKV